MKKRPTEAQLQKLCDDFNTKYPVGTEVMLKKDFEDQPIQTTVRNEAYVMSGHSAVAFFKGISGSYLIDRVSEIKP